MNARSHTADLIKGIAVLLMIQVHIIELFACTEIVNSSVGKVLMFLGGPPVAPVFMLVFGYYIAASKKTTVQLIIRGVKIFALGMLLNLALNANLILSVNKGEIAVNLWHYVFGVDILQFAGLSLILIALIKKILEKSLIIIIACIAASAFLGHYLLNFIPTNTKLQYISAFFYGSVEWSYFPMFPWQVYPLAGIAFYQLKQSINFNFLNATKTKVLLGVLFASFIAFTIRYAVHTSADLTAYYHHGLPFAAWVIAFIAFYSFFVSEVDVLLGKTGVFRYLKWLGKNVTIIYIIQWIITGNIATEIYKTVTSPLYLALSFALVLAISSGTMYLVGRIIKRN